MMRPAQWPARHNWLYSRTLQTHGEDAFEEKYWNRPALRRRCCGLLASPVRCFPLKEAERETPLARGRRDCMMKSYVADVLVGFPAFLGVATMLLLEVHVHFVTAWCRVPDH